MSHVIGSLFFDQGTSRLPLAYLSPTTGSVEESRREKDSVFIENK